MKKALVVCHMGRHYRKFGHYDIKPLQELGYEVHFAANFTLDIDKVEDDSIVLHQVDFQRSPFSIKNIKAYKQIKKIIDENDFDIIHCQSPVGGVLTRLANQKLNHKCRILYTAHGFHFYKGAPIIMWLLFYPIEKWLAKYTDTIITINKEDYNLAKNKFSKRCNKIEYIPGIGIDINKFNKKMSVQEKKELKKELQLPRDSFVLTCVGRLEKNKNQIFLINVMEQLKEDSNIHLLLVGSDELNGKYQRIVHKKHLEKNVHFLGNRNDIPKILGITDIAVSASKREGLPINVIEALASGVPVVALKCRGMEDIIKDDKNGFIVNSINDMSRYIVHLSNNNLIINQIKLNNQKTINNYSIEIISKKLKQFIK